jgi:CheY-like chemotaxis protein
MLRELLELCGHEVYPAADGPQGLAAFVDFRPNVALIDIGLPGMSGYEVAERIRSLPRGRDVYLIALTGYGQPEDRRRALAAGFDAHLVKPMRVEELNALLSQRCS